MPDPSEAPSPGWWAGLGSFIIVAASAVGIVRGIRKDAHASADKKRETEDARIDTRADARIEETVTPQIEALTAEIRAVGESVRQEVRDSEDRRRVIEQEHHEQNLQRLAVLETDMKEVKERERRRVPRPGLDS